MVVPNIPKAPGRSAPVNRFWISPEFCGVSRPAARPCGSSRATTNSWIVGAASAAALTPRTRRARSGTSGDERDPTAPAGGVGPGGLGAGRVRRRRGAAPHGGVTGEPTVTGVTTRPSHRLRGHADARTPCRSPRAHGARGGTGTEGARRKHVFIRTRHAAGDGECRTTRIGSAGEPSVGAVSTQDRPAARPSRPAGTPARHREMAAPDGGAPPRPVGRATPGDRRSGNHSPTYHNAPRIERRNVGRCCRPEGMKSLE